MINNDDEESKNDTNSIHDANRTIKQSLIELQAQDQKRDDHIQSYSDDTESLSPSSSSSSSAISDTFKQTINYSLSAKNKQYAHTLVKSIYINPCTKCF